MTAQIYVCSYVQQGLDAPEETWPVCLDRSDRSRDQPVRQLNFFVCSLEQMHYLREQHKQGLIYMLECFLMFRQNYGG